MIFRIIFYIFLMVLPSAAIADAPPALVVRELDGQTFDLQQQRGKIVIVHFWATWCPNCMKEMQALESFYRQHPQENMVILALNMDRAHMREKVQNAMQQFSYPAAMQDDIIKSSFAIPRELPVTYVIAKSGALAYTATPDVTPITEKTLADMLKPLLREKKNGN